jgi:hypothetical protein
MPDKAAVKKDGIEFRIGPNGKGAASVIPPSVHPDGTVYAWLPGLSIDDVPVAELPTVLIAMIQETEATPTAADAPSHIGGEIPEGERNNSLFKIGMRLRSAVTDIAPTTLEQALQAENRAKCIPPLPEEEVAGIARNCLRQPVRLQSTASRVLEIAEEADLWHSSDGTAYATIVRNQHREHWRLRSPTFRQWLSVKHFTLEGIAPSAKAMTDAFNVLEGRASDGPEYPVFVRVGEYDGRLYLDLTDESWRVAEVDESGWRIVSDPPVRFRRTKRMQPLPGPERGGSVRLLRRLINVPDNQWPLVLGWVVQAMRPSGPYPILKLNGEQGSAKSTTAKVLRTIIDPQAGLLQRPPRSERDLMITAANSWVPSFDNLSFITAEMSDALCMLATGGSYSTRALYSDDDEALIVAKRPVIINGIEDVGTRSDLLDRSIHLELPRIDEKHRRSEQSIMAELVTAHPLILGALLDAVSVAIRDLPTITRLNREWPRMMDFAQWAVAAEPALTLSAGEFMKAYDANRADAHQTALETSPVAVAIQRYMQGPYVDSGGQVINRTRPEVVLTATELLDAISIGQDTRARSWPKTPKVLSGVLARLAPNLRHVGIEVVQHRERNRKLWKIAVVASEADGTQGTQETAGNLSASPQNGHPAGTQRPQGTQENNGHLNGSHPGVRDAHPASGAGESAR